LGIKKPNIAYQHPNKAKNSTTASNDRPISGKQKSSLVSLSSERSDTMNVRIIAHYPVKGSIRPFDLMIDAKIDPKTAILSLLKKGIPVFENICAVQAIDDINLDFEHGSEYVETTRAMSAIAFAEARQHYDPFEVLSKRALGAIMGKAILATAMQE